MAKILIVAAAILGVFLICNWFHASPLVMVAVCLVAAFGVAAKVK